MTGQRMRHAADSIAALSRQHLDLVALWREASNVLALAVPNYQAPCWYTLDPASLLVTSHFNEQMSEIPAEWLTLEYYAEDVNKLAEVASSERGVSTLHEATGGDLRRSPRWHQNITYGGDQELIAGLRTRDGAVWGAVGLYRELGQPLFSRREQDFVRRVAPYLAAGARRALLLGEALEPDHANAPGLVVLTDKGDVEALTPGADDLLAEFPDGDQDAGRPPSAVLSVAARALRPPIGGPSPNRAATARVLSRRGRWIAVHGATMTVHGRKLASVIVEPVDRARVAPLLMSAYGLTEREQELTLLVLRGNSTVEIAKHMAISEHTVQQHLKSVFDKTGARRRRELAGEVFFSHYEPRVRDNEQRATSHRPLRGGPHGD